MSIFCIYDILRSHLFKPFQIEFTLTCQKITKFVLKLNKKEVNWTAQLKQNHFVVLPNNENPEQFY